MFSQASVILFTRGGDVAGGACIAGGMCGRGVCVAGGVCMMGGHAWQGGCVRQGGMRDRRDGHCSGRYGAGWDWGIPFLMSRGPDLEESQV